MKSKKALSLGLILFANVVALVSLPRQLGSQQNTSVRIDGDDIGGVVRSAKGPENRVWVIAETTELPTKFAKIVATEDQGRHVIPDLPKANYNIRVRGYGLVDPPKVKASPGKTLNLKEVVAPSEAAAAEYYPAIYWYSMLKIRDKILSPAREEKGNGMLGGLRRASTSGSYSLKTNGSVACHEMGKKST